MDGVVKVLLAITTIALVATLAVNATGSASVISSLGSAFSGSLGAAEKG